MQKSLYDIFSSMDVNTKQAQALLTAFSKAAVAGQTDVQTAGRATIAIMNAYKIPISDVNGVMDFQFELVKKGVGTYSEFASVLGRVIPSARNFGQPLREIGGAMVFLTRNGLSTAQAATSAARAMDALANPNTVKKLEAMGLKVHDANGNFLPMDQILGEINNKIKNMPDIQKSSFLYDLFKGSGGTIQSRRFFNQVFRDFDTFQKYVKLFGNDGGSMQKAYDQMFKQPQSQMQLLTNQWDIFKTEIGDAVTPVVQQLIKWGSQLLHWFNSLPDSVKKTIAQFGLFGAAGSTLLGIVSVLVGLFLALAAAIVTVGAPILAVVAVIGTLVAIFVALAAAVVVAYFKFKPFRDLVNHVFSDIAKAARAAWGDLKKFFDNVKQWIDQNKPELDKLKKQALDTFNQIDKIVRRVADGITKFLIKAFDFALAWWKAHGKELLDDAVQVFKGIMLVVQGLVTSLNGLMDFVSGVFSLNWKKAMKGISELAKGNIQITQGAFNIFFGWLKGAFTIETASIIDNFERFLGNLIESVNTFVDRAKSSWPAVLEQLVGIFVDIGKKLIDGIVSGMLGSENDVLNYLKKLADKIPSWAKKLMGINSPAKIMEPIGEGLSQGIGFYMLRSGAAENALGILTKKLTGQPQTGGLSSVRGGPVGAGRGGATLNIHEGAFMIAIDGGKGNVAQQVQDGIDTAMQKLLRDLENA
jgi:TP901 family phage tail tape measure protein